MFTVKKLFIKRLLYFWKYQIRLLRTVIDWTVAFYIIVPGLLFAGYQYLSWWTTTPVWVEWIPFLIILLILFRLATSGTVRLFIEDGDQLFLLQRFRWVQGILKYGMLYTIVIHTLVCSVFVALIAPFLIRHYLFTANEVVVMCLFICCFRIAAALATHLLSIHHSGWGYGLRMLFMQVLYALIFIPVMLVFGKSVVLLFGISILVLLCIAGMMKYRLKVKGAFYHDIEHERKQHMKLGALLFRGMADKKTKQRRKSPLLFAKSTLLFKQRTPSNGLAEMCIKSFVRSWAQLRTYLILISLGSGLLGLQLLPVWMKGIIWFILAIILCNLLKNYWRDTLTSPFVQLFKWKQSDKAAAAQKSVFLIVLPGFMILTLAFGLSSFSFIGACVAMSLGWFIVDGLSRVMTPWNN